MLAWSPYGNWIAFHRYLTDAYHSEILIVRADFGREYRLTYSTTDDWRRCVGMICRSGARHGLHTNNTDGEA